MSQRGWSVAVIALAVLARVSAVLVLQSHTVPRSTFEHGEIAANLLQGRGFSTRFLGVDGPTSQQAPVYPMLVASAFAVGGIESPRALLLLELGQSALGGLLAAAVIRLTRAVAPDRPVMAIVAGLVVAVHPTLVYAATHVQVASLAATLLAISIALAYRTARYGRSVDAAATGAALGLLGLTDPILGLAAPGLVWIVARGRGGIGAVRPLAIIGAVALLSIAPWIVRNGRVHGEFVPIKSTFGYAFWQGNCALSHGTDKVIRPSVDRIVDGRSGGLEGLNRALWDARHEAGYIDDIALSDADYRLLATLSEPARSRLLFRRALDDLRAEPLRYPRLCLRRLRAFVFWDESNPKTRSVLYRLGHLGLSAMAVVGWCAIGAMGRRRLWPLAMTVALIAAFHALTIVSARFHIPIEPLLAVSASGVALPIGALWRRARRRLGFTETPLALSSTKIGSGPPLLASTAGPRRMLAAPSVAPSVGDDGLHTRK